MNIVSFFNWAIAVWLIWLLCGVVLFFPLAEIVGVGEWVHVPGHGSSKEGYNFQFSGDSLAGWVPLLFAVGLCLTLKFLPQLALRVGRWWHRPRGKDADPQFDAYCPADLVSALSKQPKRILFETETPGEQELNRQLTPLFRRTLLWGVVGIQIGGALERWTTELGPAWSHGRLLLLGMSLLPALICGCRALPRLVQRGRMDERLVLDFASRGIAFQNFRGQGVPKYVPAAEVDRIELRGSEAEASLLLLFASERPAVVLAAPGSAPRALLKQLGSELGQSLDIEFHKA